MRFCMGGWVEYVCGDLNHLLTAKLYVWKYGHFIMENVKKIGI